MIEQRERIEFPIEETPSPELQKPVFDAILVHGYWMSEHNSGLALRTRLAVRAASHMYANGDGASHIVLPLGRLWGEEYESEGNLMANELEESYGVSPNAIVREGNAYSTGGEVKTFLEVANKNGWENVLDIAFEKHLKTIPAVFEQYSEIYKPKVTYQSVEKILYIFEDSKIKKLVERLGASGYEKNYYIYEKAKALAMRFPGFSYDNLEERNRKKRTKKGREFILPIDVYKL